MTIFYAKFAPSGPEAPDRLEDLKSGIPKDMVMSRNSAGQKISLFGDDVWDMRTYGAKSLWSFTSWHTGEQDDPLYKTIKEELKTIFWLVCFNSKIASDNSANTYERDLMMLRKLARLCQLVGVTFNEAAQSHQFQVALRASIVAMSEGGIALTGDNAGTLSRRLNHLHAMHYNPTVREHIHVPLIVPEQDLKEVCAMCNSSLRKALGSQKQTPLIPTRILANLLTGIEQQLTELEPYLDNILRFSKALRSPLYWCNSYIDYNNNRRRLELIGMPSYWEKEKSHAVGKIETLERYGLEKWAEKLDMSEGPNLNSIKSYLKSSQQMASILVHAYTGMRHSEVVVMPYRAYVEHEIPHFGEAGFIVSYLKKFAGDNYSDALIWATGGLAKFAVQVAQKIAQIFWALNTDAPFPEEHAPLWLSHDWAPNRKRVSYRWPLSSIQNYQLNGDASNSCLDAINGLKIIKADMDELLMFDAFRNWEEDPQFSIGMLWPLSTHQFRRSVAVYSSRSGMVSLPSLSTQYKHLSKVMTALYAENASFAKSFVGKHLKPKDGYGVLTDFRASQAFNVSVSFHERVIDVKTRLTGARGTEIQLGKDKNKLPKIMETREATEIAIRQGKMAYRETIVGGCMRKDVCEYYGIDDIAPCVFECPDAIIGGDGGKKLKIYAEGLELGMDEMDEDSLAYKTTQRELERIKIKLLDEGAEL